MPYVDADSFCAIADVEAHVQRGAFSTSTRPTTDQVQKFMHDRAMQIQAKLAEAGYPYTVENHGTPLPSTTSTEKAIKDLANSANAQLAAGDALRAHELRDKKDPSDAVQGFWEHGEGAISDMLGLIKSQATGGNARLATATGGIGAQTFAEPGFDKERSRGELFGLDTKW